MKAAGPVYLGCHVHQLGQSQVLALVVLEELQQATWGEGAIKINSKTPLPVIVF
jgi:hypothetical protein